MRKVLGLMSVAVLALGLNSLGCDSGSGTDDPDGKVTFDVPTDKDVEEPGDLNTDKDTYVPPDTSCTPVCGGKQCGSDGCGGTCGTCPNAWDECVNGQCSCTPECTGKVCGDDGCGGTCGTCATGVCNATGTKCDVCEANCDGKQCGSDGCGGLCGTCTGTAVCSDVGLCEEPIPPAGCPAIFDCLNACPPSDQTCFQTCVNEAEVEDQMAFNAVVNCLDTNGYWDCPETDSECINAASQKCENEIIACFHGNLTCAEMYACIGTCPDDPTTGPQCGSDCIGSGTVEAQQTWGALIDCLDTNGYFECPEGDNACLDTAWAPCQDEMDACVPPGTATCLEMYLCLGDCTDEACSQACLQSGSSEGKTQWNSFINCIDAAGYFECQEGDDACLEAAWAGCDAEFKACAHGDKTCKDIFDCLNACAPTDQNCALECRLTGSIAGQNSFEDVVDCIIEACPNDDTAECQNNALSGVCSSLYNTCMGS